MVSDSQFIELDTEIWGLMGLGAGSSARSNTAEVDVAMPQITAEPDADDERRIDRIIEKARFEAVMKDSVGFLFKTMGTGIGELGAGVIAAANGEARSAGSNSTGASPPDTAPKDGQHRDTEADEA